MNEMTALAGRYRYTPGTGVRDYPTSVNLFQRPRRCCAIG